MENIEKVLTMCLTCKGIRVDDKSDLWLRRESNPELYERLCERFKGKMSHGYCPEDAPSI